VALVVGIVWWQLTSKGMEPDGDKGDESGSAPTGVHAQCDDGDPCTVDRYHRFKKTCIHVPDALCSGKACKSDSDCFYAEAPCLSATCHQGECRYMKIARDECVRCDEKTPCKGTFCDPRACTGGFCRHAPRECDDGDASTRDSCDAQAGACKHESAAADGRPFACTKNTDCIHKDGDRCFAGPCKAGFCEYREVANSQCKPCTGDHDCHGSFCQWPICTGTVCVVEEVPFCTDDNPLTEDTCSETRKGCLHKYREAAPACVGKTPADDGDPKTLDVCHTETGETLHLPIGSGRCETTDKCWVTYPGAGGVCLGAPLHCHHDDACPARCDPAVGCVLDANKDCHCKTDADCDLGNPCARVFCLREDGGACWGTFINDCIPCRTDRDCRVDNWCVFGSCSPDGYCRYEDGVTCDDKDPKTFGFCHGQRDDPCTYERIYDY